MESLILNLLVTLSFLLFSARRLLTYLHAYQQEEYDSVRFLCWMRHKLVIDKRLSLGLLVLSLVFLTVPVSPLIWNGVLGTLFIGFALREADPRKTGKKKLVLTARAKRIFLFALFACTVLAVCWTGQVFPMLWLIPVHMIPLTLVISNFALQPYEDATQKKYWNEAHDKLLKLKPYVIGITGSYGKTSIKHILGHILQAAAPTLITPGSVNTPMGITRIIREQLEPRHKYMVSEMGAYGPGSIERLCRLTPPDMGIISVIGHAHYERFKSLETVAGAKFELAEAVIEKNGKVIAHEETLAFEKPKNLLNAHKDVFTTCGKGADTRLQIKGISQNINGLSVDIAWDGRDYTLEAPLFGLHHGTNMALAFAAAASLGIPVKTILTALRSTPQIAHRLEVKPQPNGGLLIDDAFNSNPAGFASALDLLDMLGREKKGRRILITPGMVELGDSHDEQHTAIGKLAAEKTDIVLAVRPERIRSFTAEIKSEGQLIEMDSFAAARAWLQDNAQANDVILIENDLPDVYEALPKI